MFELFSTSFLFSIAIIIILIGGIFAYVSYRMSEQDHKLSSMIEVVKQVQLQSAINTHLVNQLTNSADNNKPNVELEYASQLGGNNLELIDVSDDESEEEEEEELEIDDSDSDESFDEDLDEDLDIESLTDNVYENDTKVIKLEIMDQDIDCNIECNIEDELREESTLMEPLEEPIDFENDLDLKNIQMGDNEDNKVEETEESKADYKKMSLNKLREVVVSKGIVSDASKLKKNEILKLLDAE